jgi:hypothetical protein
LLSYECRNRDLPCVLALSPVHFRCTAQIVTGRWFLFSVVMVTPNIETGSNFLLSQKEQQPLVTTAWCVLRLRMEETASKYRG